MKTSVNFQSNFDQKTTTLSRSVFFNRWHPTSKFRFYFNWQLIGVLIAVQPWHTILQPFRWLFDVKLDNVKLTSSEIVLHWNRCYVAFHILRDQLTQTSTWSLIRNDNSPIRYYLIGLDRQTEKEIIDAFHRRTNTLNWLGGKNNQHQCQLISWLWRKKVLVPTDLGWHQSGTEINSKAIKSSKLKQKMHVNFVKKIGVHRIFPVLSTNRLRLQSRKAILVSGHVCVNISFQKSAI